MRQRQVPTSIIDGRFLLEAQVGAGGMGVVYRARDTLTAQTVAIKVLDRGSAPEDIERFAREAKLLAELRHPGIVNYISHGITEDETPYLAMEWLEGEDLQKHLARGPMGLSDAITLIKHTAEALAFAHERGIVHRDLKPSNIFLRSCAAAQVALLDFGISRRVQTTHLLTRTGIILGTPAYMAPEQARGEREIGPVADVFALGCTLYECLTASRAFDAAHALAALAKILFSDAPKVRDTRPDIPEFVDALLHKMLAKNPEERLPNASAVVSALEMLPENEETPSASTPNITSGTEEQHIVSVLLARSNERDRPGSERLRDMLPWLVTLGAHAEVMEDNSLIATFAYTAGVATDQAALAARCALLVKARCADAAIALCTGHAQVHRGLSVGVAIDRAASILHADGDNVRLPVIRIDDLTRGLLDSRFHTDSTSTGGYVLTSEENTLDARRPLLGRPTPCVGRDIELSMLECTLANVVENSAPEAVLVVGPPGAGKSRLRYEFLRRMESKGDDLLVMVARGDPMSAGSAHGMLGQALRRLCGILDGEPSTARYDKLAKRIARHLPGSERERVVAFMGEVAGVPFEDDANIKLRAARQDPKVMSDQVTAAMLDFLRAECSARPVLLVLDDLHWADGLTIKLIDAALRDLSDVPLMVLALGRPEATDLLPISWRKRVQRVSLRALSKKACERLVRHVLGEEVAAEAVERIVNQAAGNALFLEELIRSVAEGHGDEAPATVLAVLQTRIGRLPPAARKALRAASIFGRNCWAGGLRALLGMKTNTQTLETGLGALLHDEILEMCRESRIHNEIEYRFRHVLMRDAAYDLLTRDERREGHEQVGAFLVSSGFTDALVIAEHFAACSEKTRAVPHFVRAAEQSCEASDMATMVSCVERGIECGASGKDRGTLLSLQMRARMWQDRHLDVLAEAEETLNLLPQGGKSWCSAFASIFFAAVSVQDHAWLEKLTTTIHSVEPSPDGHDNYMFALSWLIAFACMGGQKGAATEGLLLATRLTAPGGANDRLAWGYLKVASAYYTYMIEEDLWACLGHAEEGIRAFNDAGDRHQECMLSANRGALLHALGDPVRAEEVLRSCLDTAKQLNSDLLLAYSSVYLARVLLAKTSTEDHLKEAVALAQQSTIAKSPYLVGMARGVLAEVAFRRENLAEAEQEARCACEMLRASPPFAWSIIAIWIQILVAQGRISEAVQVGEEALFTLTSLALAGFGEIQLRLALAEARHAAGQPDAATEALNTAIQRVNLRVDRIPDIEARERYIDQVPTHRRLFERANAWRTSPAARPAAHADPSSV